MRKFIETEIDGKACAFWVTVKVSDASFDHAFGTQRCLDVEFEIEECEGVSEARAQDWCKVREGRLIDDAMRDIAEREEDRQIASSV